MRKNVFGRQFGRDIKQRKSLFRSLLSSLILKESIKTTLEKAKAIKGDADKIINKAKRKDEKHAIQLLQHTLGATEINKVIKDLAPRFSDRTSGYTRIIKLERRFSDNAQMAIIEWVIKAEKSEIKVLPTGKKDEKSKPKSEKMAKEQKEKVKKEGKK